MDSGGVFTLQEGATGRRRLIRVLGVEASQGRTFSIAEERRGSALRQVVLTDGGWRRYFASDPQIIGRRIDLDGEFWTVIGVLPEGFRLWNQDDDLFLLHSLDSPTPAGDRRLTAFARLKPEVDL